MYATMDEFKREIRDMEYHPARILSPVLYIEKSKFDSVNSNNVVRASKAVV
jgi:hypothetical protein